MHYNILANCPILLKDQKGQLKQVTGFDKESGILSFGMPAPQLSFERAKILILNLLKDFHFATEDKMLLTGLGKWLSTCFKVAGQEKDTNNSVILLDNVKIERRTVIEQRGGLSGSCDIKEYRFLTPSSAIDATKTFNIYQQNSSYKINPNNKIQSDNGDGGETKDFDDEIIEFILGVPLLLFSKLKDLVS